MGTHQATANQVLQILHHKTAAIGVYLECPTLGMNFYTPSCWQRDLKPDRYENGGNFSAFRRI